MSRIKSAFARLEGKQRRGFIPFITAGDPSLDLTAELLVELAALGSTVIEIGVPFSDPMADGPVIQRASERALKNGFGIREILDTIQLARPRMNDVPVMLFSYFNPLLQYGLDRLCEEASASGVDGVLVTDLVPEESEQFSEELARNGLDMIFLVAPTSSDERLKLVAGRASGFIYAVSRAGVTGARSNTSRESAALVERVKRHSSLPIAVGFGISTREQVAETWDYADAAVVGSAIVSKIESLGDDPDLAQNIGEFCRRLLPKENDHA